MTHDELRKSLHRRAQELAEWLEGTLEVRELRTQAEIEAVSNSIIRGWGQPEPEEVIDDNEQYLYLWESLEHDSMYLIDDPDKMSSTIGFSCTPPLEVAEYLLVVGLILARSAVKHFQSKSHKRHFLAAHMLTDATEARDYWINCRGIDRCRNPDNRFVKANNQIQQYEKRLWFRERQSNSGRAGADAKHNKPGGNRDKQKQIQKLWATGNFKSRDICAEQECAALGMGFSTARKALRNTPDPT